MSKQDVSDGVVQFRPCIDIHKGRVKQIVGSTLKDKEGEEGGGAGVITNFETDKSAGEFAKMYKEAELTGGHVIMLGANDASKRAALEALAAYPGGLQVGGGMTPETSGEYLDAGASHIIVTSYVFNDGMFNEERLRAMVKAVGRERLVLDLSCRRGEDGEYKVVTDRWQKFTQFSVNPQNLQRLADSADELLIHGVDVEGMQLGIDEDLVELLGEHSPLPVTYAGGVRSLDDLETVKRAGRGNVDITVGSALDIFGGALAYTDVLAWHNAQMQ